MTPSADRPRGFSMIEVMVAMAVLAIGLIATAPLLSMAIQRGNHARKVTAAQHLAQDLLDRLHAEVRYDGSVTTATNPTLAAADAWKFDVLPHLPGVDTDHADCQLAGEDGIAYDYGPFEFVREEHKFSLCYDLESVVGAVPPVPFGTMSVRIRVFWRNATGGWTAWSLSDLLVSGA